MPRISVLIPCYNAAKYLAVAIESVLAQTVQNWELVIVDDGSTDDSYEVAASYAQQDARIQVWQQPNQGAGAARNHAFRRSDSEAEYVAFLDADDCWETDALEALLGAMPDDPRWAGAHGLCRFIDSQGNRIREKDWEVFPEQRECISDNKVIACQVEDPTTFAVLAVDVCFTIGSVLMRRSVVNAIFPFVEEVQYAEDYSMWLYMALQGDFAFINEVIVNYRKHETNTSTRLSNVSDQGNMYVRWQLLRSGKLSAEQRRIALVGFYYWRLSNVTLRMTWAKKDFAAGHIILAAKQVRHAALCYLTSLQFKACLIGDSVGLSSS